MTVVELFFATNRAPQGVTRSGSPARVDRAGGPRGFGAQFSAEGIENLRFGSITVSGTADVVRRLQARTVDGVRGDGLALAAHFRPRVARADLRVYPEQLDPEPIRPDVPIRLGSSALFLDLHARMRAASDVLVYVHGFNVSWSEAVASAAALQLMLNLPLEARVLPAGTPQAGTPQAASRGAGERAGSALAPRSAPSSPSSPVQVVLFSWPSDGRLLPFVSDRSDRTEAEGSGFALARGL
ncbi:MAG: alpha/beta hydrolase, partial [Gammaproteobacteria bacterium]